MNKTRRIPISKPKKSPTLLELVEAIADLDSQLALKLLKTAPELARAQAEAGAGRGQSRPFFFAKIGHYLYAGDSALHMAGAARDLKVVRRLIACGADVSARNRRGAQPLHYAVDGRAGNFGSPAQAAIIAALIAAGADPNALDKSGVAPLHRAVRTRSATAVETLLKHGADAALKNKSGSTPRDLALHTTGKSGSGAPEAKEQQKLILRLLPGGREPAREKK